MYTVATKLTPTEGMLLDAGYNELQYVCNCISSNSVEMLTDSENIILST